MQGLIFPNDEAQLLYEKGTPNDVLERDGRWARLYLGAHGGSIVVCQPDGSIDHYVYTDDGVINAAWKAFERAIEIRQPNFTYDHTVFPVTAEVWAWTRPDWEPNVDEPTCQIMFFGSRIDAVQALQDRFPNLHEWWESIGGEWELTGPDEDD